MRIDPENWEEWKAHPITEAMFRAFFVWAADEQQKWVAASWGNGQSDPAVLSMHRERARLLEQLSDITPEKLEEAHDEGR